MARAGTADTARARGAPCWWPGAWRSRRGLLREEAGLTGSRCRSTEVQGTGEAAAVRTLSGTAGGGVPQASEGPGPSSQDRSHARGCGRTQQVPGPPLRGSWWQAGSPASAQTRPGSRLGPAVHSLGGAALGTGPGHRPWAPTRGLCASLSEDPLLSTTPEQLDIPPAADEGPAYPPLRAARPHRLLSVQTPSHSVRRTVVLTCVSLTTGGLTVSCRRCSYLRSLGMSACTLFSCGDSIALPSEGCWPLRALEGVPLFHSWQSL